MSDRTFVILVHLHFAPKKWTTQLIRCEARHFGDAVRKASEWVDRTYNDFDEVSYTEVINPEVINI